MEPRLKTQRRCLTQQLLCRLQWVPVHSSINYKIASLAYKVPAHNQPLYLSYLLTPCTPGRTLRSQDKHLFVIPAVSTVASRQGFSYAASSVWSSLI